MQMRFKKKNLPQRSIQMLKAIGYRVLIKPDEVVTKYGSIEVVIDEKLERAAMQTATVVDIGPIAFRDYRKPWMEWLVYGIKRFFKIECTVPQSGDWIEVGDQIVFSKYGGKHIYDPATFDPLAKDHENDYYMIVDDSDVLCKIEEN